MENIKFKAEQREKTGGLSSKQSIYNDRKIPGIIYGGKDEPLPILINENDLIRVTSNAGLFNSLVEVEVGDKKEMVVFKEVQKHPSKNVFTHVDLQRVVDGTKINVVVPVVLLNQEKCFGVKIEGGVINHVLKEVSVLADPNNIPESIDVDMEDIQSKEKVRLSMLKTDGAYDFPSTLKNQDPVLVSVLTAKGGGMSLEDELEEEAANQGEGTADSGDEKAAEENTSDNSEEQSE
ncbi:MAG: 50S ribosomal protein L25 [Gammaproteobacteria bacterium]